MSGKSKPSHCVRIKPMAPADLTDVFRIEKDSFPDAGSIEFWNRELLSDLSHNFVAVIDSETKEKVVGYINFWIVAEEIQLNQVAVIIACRNSGIAARLMQAMMKAADKNRISSLTLEVRSSNVHAIKLYEKFGFVVKGIRQGYYGGSGGDALIMWADHGEMQGEM
jgi:[ribosomal protein S18]-alanine N-acetyltransferase